MLDFISHYFLSPSLHQSLTTLEEELICFLQACNFMVGIYQISSFQAFYSLSYTVALCKLTIQMNFLFVKTRGSGMVDLKFEVHRQ